MEARRGELAAISVLETAKNRMEAFAGDEPIGLPAELREAEENEGSAMAPATARQHFMDAPTASGGLSAC
jgi:hypothetical protein